MAEVAEGLAVTKEFRMPARAKMYARRPEPVRAIQMCMDFRVAISFTHHKVGRPGDYLLMRSDGSYDINTKEEFEANYEEIIVGRK